MGKYIVHDHNHDGVDRRGFLKCMAWAGTGIVWAASAGVFTSKALNAVSAAGMREAAAFRFVQISDSHIGFDREANKDVVATLSEAVTRVNALSAPPDFVIHTGDLTHLSKPSQFDTLDQVLKQMKTTDIFFVPGEHDVLEDDGALYLKRYGKQGPGRGWFSFDHRGVHFIGLVNVVDLRAGGLGRLGSEQLQWLERDVKRLPGSTPIVVFAHIPLWTIYPAWGWGTEDSARALGYLRRFGSVTVLNGHIHQTMQKVEGHVTFHTAMSTAFPQPAPGTAPGPGPLKVPAEQLRQLLGLTSVSYVQNQHSLAIVDRPLEAAAPVEG